MNLDDAISAMRYLSAMTTGWADETTAAYAVELASLDNPQALMDAVRKVAATWTNAWRPSLAIIRDAYEHETALIVSRQREELAARGVLRCGGATWVRWSDGEEVPCPTCAPVLHRIWTTPTLLHRWRAGEEAWRLMDCEDAATYRKVWARPLCAPGYHDEHLPSLERGAVRAWEAYVDECAIRGQTPTPGLFRAFVNHLPA